MIKSHLRPDKEQVKRIRAICLALGLDPTPNNVSKFTVLSNRDFRVATTEVKTFAKAKTFTVLTEIETLEDIGGEVIRYIQTIPDEFLELMVGDKSLAKALKYSDKPEASESLRKIISKSGKFFSDIQFMIKSLGLETFYIYDKVYPITFKNETQSVYTVIERSEETLKRLEALDYINKEDLEI